MPRGLRRPPHRAVIQCKRAPLLGTTDSALVGSQSTRARISEQQDTGASVNIDGGCSACSVNSVSLFPVAASQASYSLKRGSGSLLVFHCHLSQLMFRDPFPYCLHLSAETSIKQLRPFARTVSCTIIVQHENSAYRWSRERTRRKNKDSWELKQPRTTCSPPHPEIQRKRYKSKKEI